MLLLGKEAIMESGSSVDDDDSDIDAHPSVFLCFADRASQYNLSN